MLPLRNDGMRKSPSASIVLLPAFILARPRSTNPIPASTATANAIGTGDSVNGQAQPPIRGTVSTSHHP